MAQYFVIMTTVHYPSCHTATEFADIKYCFKLKLFSKLCIL